MQAPEDTQPASASDAPSNTSRGWLVTAMIIGVAGLICAILWFTLTSHKPKETESPKQAATSGDIEVDEAAVGIKLVTVTRQAPPSVFSVAGTVEPNQQQLQQVTPLVSGRVENIYVALGDNVTKGSLLVRIDSPQVAEQHGKLHEAETRLRLAQINLDRVQQAANRVSILKAKATLDEAESNLKRTKLLVSEGLTARKDLVAAQSEYERAKADYNFQRDISLNREVTQAKAEVQTAQTEAEHIRDALKALDAQLGGDDHGVEHNISKIELRSPITGTVIERFVNPGAGFEQGKPLLTIANTTTLWVIANVPETQMYAIHIGTGAKVKFADRLLSGTVSYIDPRLNEDTRTSRVRIAITNPANKIQVGSFAQVEFTIPATIQTTAFVPQAAVQTVEGKSVVFVKIPKTGKFQVRKVEVGSATAGLVPVLSGVQVGEIVAGNGSFVLKSKLLKDQFGDED